MTRKLKRTIAALSAVTMMFTTATVLPEGMSFGLGTGITAFAAGTEPQSKDEASVTINGETLYYATLEEAFSAASGKTATITMLNDAECSSTSGEALRVGKNSNITLNMNGKTLSGRGQGVGIINVGTGGSLLVQGPGTVKSTNIGLSCDSSSANMTVENITVDVLAASYGVKIPSGTVTLNNVQITGHASKYAVYHSEGNTTINNLSATETGYCDVYYYHQGTLKINGGTFDKISVKSDNSGGITSVSQLLGEGCIYRYADKTWETAELSNTLEISNVTVEKIPLTINPQAETSWYYNSAEHSLQMNAQPTTTGNEITYEWYDGDKKLECVSDTYTVPKTTSIGSYTYTCKATCDGYTLSHDFTFTVEECKHEGVEITFNNNGFGNCPKCNATVYQPATETTDKYDIDDDSIKDTVYEISNAGQLYWFAGLVNGTLDGVEQNTLANAILTTNITVNENLLNSLQYDAEGNVSNGSDFITWTPIADCMEDHITLYSGTFDGNNKTVSGLYFNGNSTRIGLFGSSEADGNIKNVGVVDSYFKGNDFVGGVCGRNDGTITNCYNAGNLTAIESSATIGGICGYNGGTVANCYNTGTVTATGPVASVGGVCGCSIAPISNCYNIGTVTATSSSADISGICGYNFGPVTNCYYLADTEDENGSKTTAQFASGEVAYLLSQGCTVGEGENAVTYSGSVWGQNLATENYPVLNGKTVYQVNVYAGCEGNPGDPSTGYSNTDASVYADHNDTNGDGMCDYCDKLIHSIVREVSATLDGDIGLNYYIALPESVTTDTGAYVQFTVNGQNTKFFVKDVTAEKDGTYKFTCWLTAKEMRDDVTFELYDGNGTLIDIYSNSGDKVEGASFDYSLETYLNDLSSDESDENAALKDLADATLVYGAYAQNAFNHNADPNLDGSDLADVTVDTLESNKITKSADIPEGLKLTEMTLILETETTLCFYFKSDNIENYTFKLDGTDVVLNEITEEGLYYVEIANISAKELDTKHTLEINDECTLTFNALSYAYATVKADMNENLCNVVKALYKYNEAANAYFK